MSKNISKRDQGKLSLTKDSNNVRVGLNSLREYVAAFGLKDVDYLERSIKDLLQFYTGSDDDVEDIQRKSNSDLAILDNLKPKDALEAIQIKDILMLHTLLQKHLEACILKDQTSMGKDLNIERVLKLTKAITSLINTYTKYSRGGHQRVTVQHVNVSDGGQAIVGNIEKK